MWWRRPRGGKLWEQSKGRPNRDAFRKLLQAGKVCGALALAGSKPVGWCCVGPRQDFPRLERTRALATAWTPRTWAITCLFIKTGWRRRGIARLLVGLAIGIARAKGAARIEAYPVTPKGGRPIPPAFAWTGVPALFEAHGFRALVRTGYSRDVYALDL